MRSCAFGAVCGGAVVCSWWVVAGDVGAERAGRLVAAATRIAAPDVVWVREEIRAWVEATVVPKRLDGCFTTLPHQ